MDDVTAPERGSRIAYLTSEYPAISHTFILREVEALRRRGLTIDTASIRRTDGATHHRGDAERAAAKETFYVLHAAKRPLGFLAAQASALAHPRRWWHAFRLALKTSPPGPRALVWQLFYLAEAAVLARHLKRRGVSHLHNHFEEGTCTVAMLTGAISGIPYSFTMHGPIVFFDVHRARLDEKIARARFVVCISDFCRSQAMLFSDLTHWGKLHIVHCAIDPDRYDPGVKPPGSKRVLFVGRLAAMKGVPILLDAFATVIKTHPDAHLTLIGDGPERGVIEARARDLGLGDNVTFAGFKSQGEVANALKAADIFALPSFAEGLPVVLMEAMAARLPVVTTRIAGIAELVEDGVNGRLVPPGNAQAFAAALSQVLSDPAAATAMGNAGNAKVRREFQSDTEAAKLAALFAGSAGFGRAD